MKIVFATTLLFLTACSTTTTTTETGQHEVVPSLAQTPYAPEGEPVLFVKLHKQDKSWQILSIASKRMPVDLLNREERLYIRTDNQQVMPDYDRHQYRDEASKFFDCTQDIKYNKHMTYNPCASSFTRNTKFGDGWFGWTKSLDTDEIQLAVKQTDLLARARKERVLIQQDRQRCLAQRKQAEKIIAQQKVALRVIDKTRLYKQGHELVSYDLNIGVEIPEEGCEQDLNKVKLNYDMGLHQNFDLVLELRGKSDWHQHESDKLNMTRMIAEADKKLIPTLYITGKKIQHYNLYKTWSNQDVAIDWRAMDIGERDLRQLFDVRNLGTSSVEIQRITFYINGHKVTRRDVFTLAPQTNKKGLEHASRYFMLEQKVRKNIDDIKVLNKKSEQAEFGVKLTYVVNDESKTLYKKDMVLLSSIL